MSATTNASTSQKSSSNTRLNSNQSKKSEQQSPIISVNLPIISSNFDKQEIRISLSDTEVQVRKQNSAFYGVTASEESSKECTPPSSTRFQIVHNERTAALQQLILEDFELKSQSTDQDTEEDEIQEETEEETKSRENEYEQHLGSDRTSIETQYSPQQQGSSESRPSGTTSSGKSCTQTCSAGRDDSHHLPSEYLVFNFRQRRDNEGYCQSVNMLPENTMGGDCYILFNLAQRTTATIEEIHSSSGRSAESNQTYKSPCLRGNLTPKVPAELLTPRLYPSTYTRIPRRMRSSNRIFPILEQTESSSNESAQTDIGMKTYDELEKHIQDIYKTAAERNEFRPPSRKSVWDEEYQAMMQSLPEVKPAVKFNETFLPNGIEEPRHVEAIVSIRNINSAKSNFQSESAPIRTPINIPEIEVIEPSSSKSSLPCKHEEKTIIEAQGYNSGEASSGCSCFGWMRKLFCAKKPPKRKRPVRIYKTYFCDICPECKCTTAYF